MVATTLPHPCKEFNDFVRNAELGQTTSNDYEHEWRCFGCIPKQFPAHQGYSVGHVSNTLPKAVFMRAMRLVQIFDRARDISGRVNVSCRAGQFTALMSRSKNLDV